MVSLPQTEIFSVATCMIGLQFFSFFSALTLLLWSFDPQEPSPVWL